MDQGGGRLPPDYESEVGKDLDDDASVESKKRKLSQEDPNASSSSQNTPHLPLWVAGGSPPQFVAPEELLKMSVAMDNLALVHEIAIDPDFSVSDIPENPIEAATILDDILSEGHVRLRAEVNSILDEIDLLGRLCAPERDPLVEKLRHEDGIIEMIKGIFRLIDVMKNDLTNYTISKNRAAVEEYSSRFEYREFMKYLEKFPGIFIILAHFKYTIISIFSDGTVMTKQWLKMAYLNVYSSLFLNSPPDAKREKFDTENPSDEEVIKSTSNGYLRLIECENPSPFPETFRIDKVRLQALSEKFLQLNVVTGALFISCNLAGKQIAESEGFKKSLKDQLIIITNDIEAKKAICEQCVTNVYKYASTLAIVFSSEQEQALREQIMALSDAKNRIRNLVCTRISTFVEEMLQSPSEVPRRLLPGLSIIQSELCAFTARYTALGLGILWGAYRLRQIREYHADIREWEHEKAVAKAASEAKQKKWLSKDEMRYIMKVADIPFEDGVAQLGVVDLFRDE
ncbi:T-complex protein 11 [Dictyocaulus viviparus]|uniref:T-complex protein 11 n=1 Tax=Dictyocaulus viviparus TaxID=29172 RepID=A0A0D8XZ37_DICVI|nr:T-complex protein 11 [Dictyocaulus viviparus]